MSGGNRCLYALVFALWFGTSWNCWADETSTGKVQPEVNQTLKLEILKRPPAPKQGENISPEDAIRRALETRVRAKIDEALLQDVCTAIGKQLRIPIILDRKSLGDEGLDGETPISCSINNDRLLVFLKRMLHELDLTMVVKNDVLLITTMTCANEMLETRVYDVADLAALPEFGVTNIQAVADFLTDFSDPESWSMVGGEGSCTIVEGRGVGSLMISQTLIAHNEIERLLGALRQHLPENKKAKGKESSANKSKAPAARDLVKVDGEQVVCAEEAIRLALRKKIDLEFDGAPLRKVAKHLAELLRIKVRLHKESLNDEGIDVDVPISFQSYGISAESALNHMLRDHDLTYVIKDDLLLIMTSCTEQCEFLEIKLYDVADIIGGDFIPDGFADSIKYNVHADSWMEVGGEGDICLFENAGMRLLAVTQTQKVHCDIKKFLTELRKIQQNTASEQKTIQSKQTTPVKAGSSQARQLAQHSTYHSALSLRPSFRYHSTVSLLGPMGLFPGEIDFFGTEFWAPQKDSSLQIIVKGNNRFAFELYAKLREKSPGENIFFSPISVSSAMAMTHAGARGKTAGEIARTMHFNLPLARLHPTYKSLLALLKERKRSDRVLNISNHLWIRREQVVLDDFEKILRNYYKSECKRSYFVGNRKTATMSEAEATDDETRLILTSSTHLLWQWNDSFNSKNTALGPFFAEDGQKQVKLMTMEDGSCRYAEIEEAGMRILEKPFRSSYFLRPNTGLSMLILLPRSEPGSLAKLEANLTPEKLTDWCKNLRSQTVEVCMPKFEISTHCSLKKMLTELGMPLVFKRGSNNADFSGMDGTRELFLQDIIHITSIDVADQDNQSTAWCMHEKSAEKIPPLPLKFRADHPFVFLIRDNRTGSILFLGRFCGP